MKESSKKWKKSITSADENPDGFMTKYRPKFEKLFDEIDREFDQLFSENLQLREKIHEYEHGFEKISEDTTDGKSLKKRNQISEKIKMTYKSSTSKLVSSLKGPAGSNVPGGQATPSGIFIREYVDHRDGIWDVCTFGNNYVISACADHLVRIYNASTSSRIGICHGHAGSVNSVRCNINKLCLSSSGDGSLRIWKLPPIFDDDEGEKDYECECLKDINVSENVVISSDWLGKGEYLIAGSWDRLGYVIDSETGKVLQTLTGHDSELTQVSAALDDQQYVLTSSNDATFRLWDLREFSRMQVHVFSMHSRSVSSAVWATSDRIVSASDDRTCLVWDMKNMRVPISKIQTDSGINKIAVHPHKNIIALPQDNKQLRIYDLLGNRLARLPRHNGHSKMVCSAAWFDQTSPSLVTAGFDKRLIAWKFPIMNLEEKLS